MPEPQKTYHFSSLSKILLQNITILLKMEICEFQYSVILYFQIFKSMTLNDMINYYIPLILSKLPYILKNISFADMYFVMNSLCPAPIKVCIIWIFNNNNCLFKPILSVDLFKTGSLKLKMIKNMLEALKEWVGEVFP